MLHTIAISCKSFERRWGTLSSTAWMSLTQKHLIPFWSSLLCGFILLLPKILGWSFNYEDFSKNDAPISLALSSNKVKTAVVGCIALTIPVTMDLVLDTIFIPSKDITMKYLRWTSILCLIPNLLFLSIVITFLTDHIEFIPVIFLTFRTSIIHFCLFWMNRYDAVFWSVNRVIFLSVLIAFSNTVCCFNAYVNFYPIVFLDNVLHTAFGISFVGLVFIWVFHCFVKYRGNLQRQSSSEKLMMYTCNVNLLSVFIFIGVSLILSRGFNAHTWARSGPVYVSLLIYLHGAFILSNFLIIRAVRYEAIRIQETLMMRKRFVAYANSNIHLPLRRMHTQLREKLTEVEASDDYPWDDIRMLQDMKEDCANCLGILDDLIVFDRLESALTHSHVAHLNAWSFVRDAVRPYLNKRYSAGFINFGLAVNPSVVLDLDCCSVFGDKPMLVQVVRTLVDNAMRFSPVGGHVTVCACLVQQVITAASTDVPVVPPSTRPPQSNLRRQDTRDTSSHSVNSRVLVETTKEDVCSGLTMKTFVQIDVTDSGPGLSQSRQTRLFRRLGHFPSATRDAELTSGMGLWMSGGIVEMHGGQLTVLSDGLDEGCTFRITLPVSRQYQRDENVDILSNEHLSHPANEHGTESQRLKTSLDGTTDLHEVDLTIGWTSHKSDHDNLTGRKVDDTPLAKVTRKPTAAAEAGAASSIFRSSRRHQSLRQCNTVQPTELDTQTNEIGLNLRRWSRFDARVDVVGERSRDSGRDGSKEAEEEDDRKGFHGHPSRVIGQGQGEGHMSVQPSSNILYNPHGANPQSISRAMKSLGVVFDWADVEAAMDNTPVTPGGPLDPVGSGSGSAVHNHACEQPILHSLTNHAYPPLDGDILQGSENNSFSSSADESGLSAFNDCV